MSTFRNFSYGRPMEDVILFFDDFHKYAAGDWTLTTVEAGAGSATEALGSQSGGVLVVTNDSADDDSDFFQTPNEPFKFVAGKKMQIKGRFKLSDATQSDFIFGLIITDTAPLAHTDGIVFHKDDGDAFLDFKVTKDSSATSATAIATLSDNTWFTVEAYYDGSNEFALFVDGVAVGKCLLTTVPDDEELAVSFGLQNGAAASKVLSVDYVKVLAER